MTKKLIVLAATWCLSAVVSPLALPCAQTPRAQAEEAIRKAIYDLEYAYATGDVETVRRLTANRTLGLYRLYFTDVFAKLSAPLGSDPRAAGIRDGDDYFAFMIRATASAVGRSLKQEEIRKRARREAARKIVFVDERTAKIEADAAQPPSLAVFEDGRWKIDSTESLKEDLRQSEALTEGQRESIRKY